jgi:dihydrodiol dehydrogenase / D-xylose 1-dehydrogenase (NADP)
MYMKKIIKWGIFAPGVIAHKFAQGLKCTESAQLFAVGSRSLEKAEDFAKQYDIPRAYGSYEELVADPEVDVIYVATPHPMHKDAVLMCLKAGKAVLCEKPITLNSKEAEEIIQYARESKVFLMEAMWSRFLPVAVKVREWLNRSVIGDIRMLKADFGFRCEWNPDNRLLKPELGGGALLDVGIYVISLASMVFGREPSNISSLPHIGKTGVDEQFAAIFGYDRGELAVLTAAVRTATTHDAYIYGTKGYIHIPNFWQASLAAVYVDGKITESFEVQNNISGYSYEAYEVMDCLREGKTESNVMPLEETLTIMRTMDKLRKQWGLKYPMED